MAAQQAVFDTYELLENIILQLPGHHVPRLQLISKTWKDFINSSSAIRRHYNNGSLVPVRWSGWDANIPVYDESPNIKLHPLFRRSLVRPALGPSVTITELGPHDVMKSTRIRSEDLKSQQMISAKQEFLTKPSCQYLHVFIWDNTDYGEARYVKEGFKISDLLDLAKEYEERRFQSWPHASSRTYDLTLLFKEDTSKEAWWKQSKPVEKKFKAQGTQA